MTKSRPSGLAQDAIALLTADHKKVRKLFGDFRELNDNASEDDKSTIVEQVCDALTVHATIEEEIFYPAVRYAIDDDDLMDEALVEHAGAKDLIAQLQSITPDDELYDAKVTVLWEQIDHHVKEEEGKMFPKAKKAKLDLAALGEKMMERKTALMRELGIEEEEGAQKHRSPRGRRAG